MCKNPGTCALYVFCTHSANACAGASALLEVLQRPGCAVRELKLEGNQEIALELHAEVRGAKLCSSRCSRSFHF